MTKVMFLVAVERPQWDSHKKCWWDGKVGCWPLVETVPVQRDLTKSMKDLLTLLQTFLLWQKILYQHVSQENTADNLTFVRIWRGSKNPLKKPREPAF